MLSQGQVNAELMWMNAGEYSYCQGTINDGQLKINSVALLWAAKASSNIALAKKVTFN